MIMKFCNRDKRGPYPLENLLIDTDSKTYKRFTGCWLAEDIIYLDCYASYIQLLSNLKWEWKFTRELNITDVITETSEVMAMVEISKEEVNEIFGSINKKPCNENGDVDESYISGEVIYHFNKENLTVGEVLLFPVYKNEDGEQNGDFIDAPNRFYDQVDKVREFIGHQLCNELTDVCIDENECIDTDWYIFKKGTNRYDIWHWFEKWFEINVPELLT